MFCFLKSYLVCHPHTCSPNKIAHFCNALVFQILDQFIVYLNLQTFLLTFLNVTPFPVLPSTIICFNCPMFFIQISLSITNTIFCIIHFFFICRIISFISFYASTVTYCSLQISPLHSSSACLLLLPVQVLITTHSF